MILILLVIHIVISSDGPVTKEQYLAVDTTQTDELLSDNETTYLIQFSDTMRISSNLSQGRQTRGGQGGHGHPTFLLSNI